MYFVTAHEDHSHGQAEFLLRWTGELAECALVFKYIMHFLALYQERI